MEKCENTGFSIIAKYFSIEVSCLVRNYGYSILNSNKRPLFTISMSRRHAAKIAVFLGFCQYFGLDMVYFVAISLYMM